MDQPAGRAGPWLACGNLGVMSVPTTPYLRKVLPGPRLCPNTTVCAEHRPSFWEPDMLVHARQTCLCDQPQWKPGAGSLPGLPWAETSHLTALLMLGECELCDRHGGLAPRRPAPRFLGTQQCLFSRDAAVSQVVTNPAHKYSYILVTVWMCWWLEDTPQPLSNFDK